MWLEIKAGCTTTNTQIHQSAYPTTIIINATSIVYFLSGSLDHIDAVL